MQAVGLAALVILLADWGVKQITNKFRKSQAAEAAPRHRMADKEFHHTLRPASKGLDRFGSTRVEYAVNSLGFRDATPRKIPWSSSQPRVLLLGDSYAEGIGVPWGETVAGVLQADLAARGVEVLNGAVAGYSPSFTAQKLKRWFLEKNLTVDLVIMLVDISDVEDELKLLSNPDGSLTISPQSPFGDPRYLRFTEKIDSWLKKTIEPNFVILGAGVRNLLPLLEQQGWFGVPLGRATWPDYQGPGEVVIAQGLSRAEKSMTEIRDLCRGRARLWVVVYPWLEQIRARRLPCRQETFWQTWGEAQQVPVFSLFPLMLSLGPQFEKDYCLPGDGHWNGQGSKLVAHFLLDKIYADWGRLFRSRSGP